MMICVSKFGIIT